MSRKNRDSSSKVKGRSEVLKSLFVCSVCVGGYLWSPVEWENNDVSVGGGLGQTSGTRVLGGTPGYTVRHRWKSDTHIP